MYRESMTLSERVNGSWLAIPKQNQVFHGKFVSLFVLLKSRATLKSIGFSFYLETYAC